MPNSKSSREPINKIETGYCSRSRWGDRWVNWEGTSQYRNERDHVNPEATVEAVPAFLQKCLAGQNLLPLLGWWATPESWRSFHVCIESDREQQYPCPEKQRTFVSKAESAGLWQGKPIKRTAHILMALDQLGWEKGKERRAVVCCMTGRKTPMPAYLWWWWSVTPQLRIMGTEILSPLQ